MMLEMIGFNLYSSSTVFKENSFRDKKNHWPSQASCVIEFAQNAEETSRTQDGFVWIDFVLNLMNLMKFVKNVS